MTPETDAGTFACSRCGEWTTHIADDGEGLCEECDYQRTVVEDGEEEERDSDE